MRSFPFSQQDISRLISNARKVGKKEAKAKKKMMSKLLTKQSQSSKKEYAANARNISAEGYTNWQAATPLAGPFLPFVAI